MKNKVKKIMTATILSALSFTAIGCGTNNSRIAKNIDSSMAKFVTSINNLDYVDTSKPNEKVGKLVETSSMTDQNKYMANTNSSQYLNKNAAYSNIESTITKPEYRTDSFRLFVLSDSPFITLSTGDNMASLNIGMRFSTDKIEDTSTEIQEKINKLILKRSILMIYVNEIYNDKVNLSDENKVAINAYVNVIKENTSYLNGNRGMVKNQLKLASDLTGENQNNELINYYIIKSGEALETRLSKLDSALSAIDSIINIIESNLSSSSSYYHNSLSESYDKFLTNISGKDGNLMIEDEKSNQKIAKNIAETLNLVKFSANNDKICENCEDTNNVPKLQAEPIISPAPTTNKTTEQGTGYQTPTTQNQGTYQNSSTNNSATNQSSDKTNSGASTIGNTSNNKGSFISTQNSTNSHISNTRNPNDTVIKPTPSYTNGATKNRTYRSNLTGSNQNHFNNTSNSNTSTNSKKEDSSMNRQNVYRAKRTPEQEKQEEYTSYSNNNLDYRTRNTTFTNR